LSANPERFGVRRGWVLLVLGLPVVLAVACVIYLKFHAVGDVQTQTIEDVTRPQTLVFKAKSEVTNRMHLWVSGEVMGKGTLAITDKQTRAITGRVSFEDGGDYYRDSMTVEYKPDGVVTGGGLGVRVEFR
jgi:hypothetical protein